MSSDYGNTWSKKDSGLAAQYIWCISITGNNIFVGSMDGGVFQSTDNGNNWLEKNSGLTNTDISSLCTNDKYIYVGTRGCGVFRAKLSEITAVADKKQISDNRNYPNPTSDFLNINSENIIGRVISIYDMLGNKLMSITAESPETRMNIESLPIGVYLIRIGNNTQLFVKE
jgi:hypothetical protein